MPNRRQAIIWINADPINWRIYAALVGDALNTLSGGTTKRSVLVFIVNLNLTKLLMNTILYGVVAGKLVLIQINIT